MIEYRQGDILQEHADALVNTVNCVGIMGRGIALQFKKAFPDNFKAYAKACKREEVVPGRIFVHRTGRLQPPRYILNFPTKRHWRSKSRLEDIESGLEDLVRRITELDLHSIAVPPLGSGLGGLDWGRVRDRIEQALGDLLRVRVIVFRPGGEPSREHAKRDRPAIKMTPGRAALLLLMRRYLGGALDPFVSLLEIHKLMYFLQEAGEPLRLQFVKGHYGPYAENLRHVLHAVEGRFLSGYADGGDAPGKPIELVPAAVPAAEALVENRAETRERLQRVGGLVEGFETPFGLELLSTVHWLVTHEGISSGAELQDGFYAWGPSKRGFSARQIRLASETLERRGWLSGPDEPG